MLPFDGDFDNVKNWHGYCFSVIAEPINPNVRVCPMLIEVVQQATIPERLG